MGWAKEHEDVFIDAIKEARAKKVGVEISDYLQPEITRVELDRIIKGLPEVKFVDGSDLIMEQRMIKSEFEQDIISELVRKVCGVVEKSLRAFRPGMTERDLHRMFWLGFVEEGIHEDPMTGRFMITGPGHYQANIFGPHDTPLHKGDTLFIDGGPRYKGYFCDIQRDICIGKPSELVKKLHRISMDAFEAALEAVKPGAKASDVYFAAKKALKKADPRYEMRIFAGHSVGLYTHELPYLDEKTHVELKPGMYLAIEVAAPDLDSPTAPRCALMMPEDNLIVTEKEFDNLSDHLSKELWIIE